MSSSSPVQITDAKRVLPQLTAGTGCPMGGIWGVVRAGQVYLTAEGKRLVISADTMQIAFLVNNKAFVQNPVGFINDVRTYPILMAGKAGEKVVEIGYAEVKFAIGIAAGASGVAFAIVIGSEITEFIVEHREDFGKWA